MSSVSPDILQMRTGFDVVECGHCGWRGVENSCNRQRGSLPVEATCPFCRREFICIAADCNVPNGRQTALARCLELKLVALSLAPQGS